MHLLLMQFHSVSICPYWTDVQHLMFAFASIRMFQIVCWGSSPVVVGTVVCRSVL